MKFEACFITYKTLIKHVFLLNFLHELLMIFETELHLIEIILVSFYSELKSCKHSAKLHCETKLMCMIVKVVRFLFDFHF